MKLIMRGLWAVLVMAWAAAVVVWAASNCNTHKTCTDCIISPSCIWCGKENFTELPRCGSDSSLTTYYASCEGFMTDPRSFFVSIDDHELSGDDASAQEDTIIQIRPQKVEMYSRVGEENQIVFSYKHLRNYPVDLYYLMDGSKSMSDDKEMLTQLGNVLVDSMKKITSNFKVGFGIFVDKTILPFISTLPFKYSASCKECEAPYSYKNVLKLTDNSTAFVDAVNNSKSATNLDYPEGSLDALMQAIVCEEQVDWRQQSIRLILVSTDAGFHIAGDGKLGGITRPNDRSCHLDRHGVYTHDAILDYPSIGEIREMVEEKEVHLIFAITKDQEPLYDHLKDLIPRTTYNILAQDSSNIIDILTNKVKDVIGRVSLRVKESLEDISVKLYTNCSGGSWQEHTSCTNLNAGDEVTFRADVVVKKCPEDKKWKRSVTISPGSYTSVNLTLDLTMICECKCEKPGDQGFVPNADQCSKHGDYKCGMCSCHAGYRGHKCECDVSAGDGTISDASCKHTNSSLICSGQGECKCGECECDERTQPERIWGEFCECTNYKECTSPDGGELCSNNGECECNTCVCHHGWVGQFCECDNSSQLHCTNPQTGEICSGQGDCECNHCMCETPYFGKFCEDCPECSGKCEEFTQCVKCQVFSTGELHAAGLCRETCRLFNSTTVESIAEMNGQTCTYFDGGNCRVYFVYETTTADGELRVWVQETVDCPTYHSIYYTMLGVVLAVVLIGVCALIAWRILVSLHDKREFEKFILDKQNAKWSEDVNPLYKPAITHINNPMFATKMD